MEDIQVTKRNGTVDKFDVEKINRVIHWAIDGVNGVNLSDIEMNAKLTIRNGITTKEIHDVIIESAANLISTKNPNYQVVAGRLLSYQLRKEVWGGKNPPKLLTVIKDGITKGIYTPEFLEWFSVEEINKLDEHINHDLDFNFNYAGIRTLIDKYLIQDRVERKVFESPQFAYMLIAMSLYHNVQAKNSSKRLEFIKGLYDQYSKWKINLPTPIMAGARTRSKSFASCMLVDCDDTLSSIFATNTAIGMATASRYGIGINGGRLRAIGAPVRSGEVVHTGLIPFFKMFEATVKSCQQGGLRGGSATMNVPVFHYEIEDVVQLKNNAGTDDNRVRKLDYVVGMSKIFYTRFLQDKTISLFSPHEARELFEAFGTPDFDELYVKFEARTDLRFVKKVEARKLFGLLVKERVETGRIYILNVDHVNDHGPFLDVIRMTNLCVEVTHPTVPLQDINDPNGEIGVCILSALNLLECSSTDASLEKTCMHVVRQLDELIDYQDYFCPAAENFAKKRRSLGIGVTNFAAWLAKHNLKWGEPDSLKRIHELFEKIQFFLIKASMELAKEKGPCEKFDRTKYAQGIFPIDSYKKDVDELVPHELLMDWAWLKAEVAKHGMRNSTLTCQMPCESSSQIQTSTNGVRPPRELLSYKRSKVGTMSILVPNIEKWKNRYQFAFQIPNRDLITTTAVIQKFMDMSISFDMDYDFSKYEGGRLPDSEVIKDMLMFYKYGGKSIYYTNTLGEQDETSEEEVDTGCESGACAI